MKKKIVIIFSLFLSIWCFSQKLETDISKKAIRYGEPIVLKLQVESKKEDTVIFPLLKDTLSYHLEILDNVYNKIIQNDKALHYDSIVFSIYELGDFTVPKLKVLINSEEYFTPEYKIRVDSMVLDTLKQSLYDIHPIIIDPLTFWDYLAQYWVYLIMVLAILVITITVIILYYKERKKKGRQEKRKPYDILALERIDKLSRCNYPEKNMSKKFYLELIEILKEYIEARWKFPAFKLFSSDLIFYMLDKNYISEEEQQDLDVIFTVSDMVKFAKSTPSIQESKQHLELVRKFIEKTKEEFLNLENERIY